jgi:hypothetical protein
MVTTRHQQRLRAGAPALALLLLASLGHAAPAIAATCAPHTPNQGVGNRHGSYGNIGDGNSGNCNTGNGNSGNGNVGDGNSTNNNIGNGNGTGARP